jgi:hypothetical protein
MLRGQRVEATMRALLFSLALLCLGPTGALADSPPIHDCLEGGSMDYTPADRAIVTQTPLPGTGS